MIHKTLIYLIGLVLATTTLQASPLVSFSSDITLLDPAPSSTQSGDLKSDNEVFVFQEKQNVTLSQDIDVDVISPGSFGDGQGTDPGIIAAGTLVDSYYVHSQTGGGVNFQVDLAFDSEILGLIASSSNHAESNGLLGLSSTNYDSSHRYHLPGQDSLILSSDRKNLHLSIQNGGGIDKLRVVLASSNTNTVNNTAVPEPTSFILLMGALLGGCFFYHSSRQK